MEKFLSGIVDKRLKKQLKVFLHLHHSPFSFIVVRHAIKTPFEFGKEGKIDALLAFSKYMRVVPAYTVRYWRLRIQNTSSDEK